MDEPCPICHHAPCLPDSLYCSPEYHEWEQGRIALNLILAALGDLLIAEREQLEAQSAA